MTILEIWPHAPVAKALGWTLVHFVWEGAATALVLAAALQLVRSSRARYGAACLAMLAMLAGFGLTFARFMPPRGVRGAERVPGIPPDASELGAGAKTLTQRTAED